MWWYAILEYKIIDFRATMIKFNSCNIGVIIIDYWCSLVVIILQHVFYQIIELASINSLWHTDLKRFISIHYT